MVSIAKIRQDQYPATAETQCIKVYIPAGDEFKQLLAGLISVPCRLENYEDPESAQADGLMAVWQDAYLLTDWNDCGTPPECQPMDSEITLSPQNMTVQAGNALGRTANSGQLDSTYYNQTPSTNLSTLVAQRYMEAGVWGYRLVGVRNVDAGILQFRIYKSGLSDALDVTSDFYNSSLALNHSVVGTFTLSESGLWFISFKVNGKNASSSNYTNRYTILEMWRVSD